MRAPVPGPARRRRATAPPLALEVADMTSRRNAPRWRRASRRNARPRSACRLRSWNSSKITAATPSSAGSSCNSESARLRLRPRSASRVRRVCRAACDSQSSGRGPRRASVPCVSNRARSEPPRLEHEQPLLPHPRLIEQRERDQSAFARARRRLHHDPARACELRANGRQHFLDGKVERRQRHLNSPARARPCQPAYRSMRCAVPR